MSRLDLNTKQFQIDERKELKNTGSGPAFPLQDRTQLLAEFDQEQNESLSPSFLQLVQTGDEQFLAGSFAQAKRFYLSALREPHVEGEVLFNLYKNMGNIAMHEGDLDSAEEFYNKSFTMNPDSDILMVNYGSLAIHRGELDLAVRRFRRAVEINSRNAKAWTGLAMVHREFGDSELAWANVESALDIFPGNESAIRLVAEWAMKDNELERAVRLIGNYLSVEKKDALLHLLQSKFLFFFGRLEEALIHIKASLSINPQIQDGYDLFEIIKEEIKVRAERFK